MAYSGAVLTGAGLAEQVVRISEQGFRAEEIGEFAANLLPLMEGVVAFLGTRSGSSGGRGGGGGGAPRGEPVEPDFVIARQPRRDPASGRVTASVTDPASGRRFDADFDPATGIGQIVDRRSRAVIGIIEGGEIRPPAAAALPAAGPPAAPGWTPPPSPGGGMTDPGAYARTARPGEVARTARPGEVASTLPPAPGRTPPPSPGGGMTDPGAYARTARPGEVARTAHPGEVASTVPPPARGGATIPASPPPAPARPAAAPALGSPAPHLGLPPGVTALSTDEVIAQYRRDPGSVFPAPSNDWYRQGIAGEHAFARAPRHAVGVPALTLEGDLPVAVRAGDVVVVDAERWPAALRGEIGLPASVRAPTLPSIPPAPVPAAPRAAPVPRATGPSTPVQPHEAIAQYRRDPRSVLFHPKSRAFRQTLVLEGFEGDEWPVAVRSGGFVIVDVEGWPAHLRTALGLSETP